jgi:hypothetical protein
MRLASLVQIDGQGPYRTRLTGQLTRFFHFDLRLQRPNWFIFPLTLFTKPVRWCEGGGVFGPVSITLPGFVKKSEIFLFFETPDLLRFDAAWPSIFSQNRDRVVGRARCLGDQFIK